MSLRYDTKGQKHYGFNWEIITPVSFLQRQANVSEKKKILGLEDDIRVLREDEKDIEKIALDYFLTIFQINKPSYFEPMVNVVKSKVTP